MKTQQVTLTASAPAAVALKARRFVGFAGNVCPQGGPALGVADVDTDAGFMAPVNVSGVILVEAGAAVEAGGKVQSDADGRAVPLAMTQLADKNSVPFAVPAMADNGVAWDAATQAGDLIRILR